MGEFRMPTLTLTTPGIATSGINATEATTLSFDIDSAAIAETVVTFEDVDGTQVEVTLSSTDIAAESVVINLSTLNGEVSYTTSHDPQVVSLASFDTKG